MSSYTQHHDEMDLGSIPLPLPGVGTPVLQLRDGHYDPRSHLPVSGLTLCNTTGSL